MKPIFSERNKGVLQLVISEYISSGEPVGSRTISKKYNIVDLSPATIRNVMADLEELEFLSQPHASAGRVPTNKGFRFYVDYILEMKKLTRKEKENIKKKYQLQDLKDWDLIRETSRILSNLSHHTGIALAPKFAYTVFKHVEFIKLDGNQVLVIFISRSGRVEKRIVEIEEDLNQDELDKFTKYLNDTLSGLNLKEAKEKIKEELKKGKNIYDKLVSRALKLSKKALNGDSEVEIYVEGKTNFLDYPEFSQIDRIKPLLEALEQKNILVKLLDKAMEDTGVKVFIGSETKFQEMEGCSVITSSYAKGSDILGTLGIIGPIRMNYFEIIPLVDYTAKLVSKMLTK